MPMLSDFRLDRIINTALFMDGALERPLFVGVAIFGSIPYPTKHTAPGCASSGGPFFKGSLFVVMMYLRGYLTISGAT